MSLGQLPLFMQSSIPTISGVLGSRLIYFFGNSYSSGTWTDSVSGIKTFVQSTSADRPTTATSPGGTNTVLVFNGTSDFLQINSALSPPGGGYRFQFGIFKYTGSLSNSTDPLLVWDESSNFGTFVDPSGVVGNAKSLNYYTNGSNIISSTTNVCDSAYHTYILYEDVPDTEATLYLDGNFVGDFISGTNVSSTPYWSSGGLGVGGVSSGAWFQGNIGAVGFAQSSSPFSAGDISNLSIALANW